MPFLTPLGGLIIAVYLAVSSQTATSPTFKLAMAVAAGICFLLDLFFHVRANGWPAGRTPNA